LHSPMQAVSLVKDWSGSG